MGELNVFKVLSDGIRREILEMLRDGRMSAGEIAEKLGVTPAALSYHLKLLREAGMVMEYKQKNFVYYEINLGVFEDIVLWIESLGGKKNEK